MQGYGAFGDVNAHGGKLTLSATGVGVPLAWSDSDQLNSLSSGSPARIGLEKPSLPSFTSSGTSSAW